uniref:Kelch-like protein 18 n=2 Tax=Schistocephalus solidus TaxID=70667 RepID=A0A0X3NKC7_SCHSO
MESSASGLKMPSDEGEEKIVVFGLDDTEENWYMQTYNPDCENGEILGQMKRGFRTAFVALKESVFAIGGRVKGEFCTTHVEEFNFKERHWKPRAALLAGRDNHVAVALKIAEQDAILVCGGWNKKDEELRSCELFLPQENRWHRLPEMRERRECPAAAALPDGRAFVLGGHDGVVSIASVEYCHLRPDWQETAAQNAKFWKPVASMLTPRSYLGAVEFKGKIIVVGGSDDHQRLKSVEMFTPPTDDQGLGQWTRIADMHNPRCPLSLVVYKNKLIPIKLGEFSHVYMEELGPEETTNGQDADDLSTWKWTHNCHLTRIYYPVGAICVKF